MKNKDKKRCCRTCIHFIEEDRVKVVPSDVDGICYEGGFSDISDADKEITKEDCNCWRS